MLFKGEITESSLDKVFDGLSGCSGSSISRYTTLVSVSIVSSFISLQFKLFNFILSS